MAGRAGRSPLGGKVVLQTYQPDHYAIQMAAKHDYKGFFEQEMTFRRQLGYPPFSRLVRLEFRHHDPIKAEETAREVARRVENWIEEDRSKTELIGPLPSYFSRAYGQYRWQIILRGPDPVNLPVSYTHLDVYKRQIQGCSLTLQDCDGHFSWCKHFDEAEVHQFEQTIGCDFEVARLNIPVNNGWILSMQVFQRTGKLSCPIEHFLFREENLLLACFDHRFPQIFPRHEIHNQVIAVLDREEIRDFGEVWICLLYTSRCV